MFCKYGGEPLGDATEQARFLASLEAHEHFGANEHLTGERYSIEAAINACQAWILFKFLEKSYCQLSHADGSNVRPSKLFFFNQLFTGLDHWVWPESDASQELEILNLEQKTPGACMNAFAFINPELGVVRSEFDPAVLTSFPASGGKEAVEICSNFKGWGISLELLVSPREDCIPMVRASQLAFLNRVVDALNTASGSEPELAETPETIELPAAEKLETCYVLKCVLEAYPSGKGRHTWQEVEDKIGYSRRTIMRYTKNSVHYKDWSITGD